MAVYLTRQRDFKDGCLYIELAVGGPSKAGKDILTPRYYGEKMNLVDPRDAVRLAETIFKKWDKDYGDETKRLRIVGINPIITFDMTAKGIIGAKNWAEKLSAAMKKCAACNKIMGNRSPFEHTGLANQVFCTEYCIAKKYRDNFGVELEKMLPKKKGKLK